MRDGVPAAADVLDNSYPNNRLTLTDRIRTVRKSGWHMLERGGVMEGDIRVHTVRWTIADPQGNSRSTNVRVEVRRPTLTAQSRHQRQG